MRAPIFQLDAFSARRFAGNPAAVVILDQYPDDDLLQAIAAENNLAETAFLVPAGGDYRLRWFTPSTEVPLCGHATLASAAVVMERLEAGRSSVVFESASGPLPVTRRGDAYCLDFPAGPSQPIEAPQPLVAALGVAPDEVWVGSLGYLALLDSAASVRDLSPDMAALSRLDRDGVIVTAAGDGRYDFISRFFAPRIGVPEDPVTGAAHCMLTPYWTRRLGKSEFVAYQASRRGGEVVCRLNGERVELEGRCVFYLEGEVAF